MSDSSRSSKALPLLAGAGAAITLAAAIRRWQRRRQPGNPVLFEPSVVRGKHVASNEEFMDQMEMHFKQNLRDYEQDPAAAIAKARHISTKTMKIDRRYFCRPIDKLHIPITPQEQRDMYIDVGIEMAIPAIRAALRNGGLEASDIGCILFVSHSPFPFPPFTAHLMSKVQFKEDCVQIPVNAMGCAGGGFSFHLARDYLLAHPKENVLILSVELCSLGFRTESKGMSWFLNSALFGDAVAAAVVRGAESIKAAPVPQAGLEIVAGKQRHVPNTTHVSYFRYTDWGYDFITTEELCDVVRNYCPDFAADLSTETFQKHPKDIRLNIVHPGGAKMVKDAAEGLGTKGTLSHEAAIESMANGGNLASSTVIDMVRWSWGHLQEHDEVIAMGMGPGFVMDGVAMRMKSFGR